MNLFISDSGTLKEVSSISNVSLGVDDRIINKREISTKVLAQNNQTVVLGGLIDETNETTLQKVPLLGSIPLIGRFFRSSKDAIVIPFVPSETLT